MTKRKKKNVILDETGNVLKVGTVSVIGHGALGAIAGVPGMPAVAVGTANLAGAGLRLATLGQVLKSGATIGKSFIPKKKKTGNKILDRIW